MSDRRRFLLDHRRTDRRGAIAHRAAVRGEAAPEATVDAVSNLSIGVIAGVLLLAFTVLMVAAPDV